jgi:hypothetical protein
MVLTKWLPNLAAILFLPFENRTQKVSEKPSIRKLDCSIFGGLLYLLKNLLTPIFGLADFAKLQRKIKIFKRWILNKTRFKPKFWFLNIRMAVLLHFFQDLKAEKLSGKQVLLYFLGHL